MRREILGRLGAEFAIIVLGVLVALGVDDWRSTRQEHAREAYFLSGLAEDLRADIADFETARRNGQARVAAASYVTAQLGARRPAAESLLGIGGDRSSSFAPDPAAPVPGDLTAGLQQLARVSNFDFATGTYQEILSSGNLDLIRSEAVRRAVSQYYAFTADRGESDNRIRQALFEYYEALGQAGLAPGDDGELLRRIPAADRETIMAAIRLGWGLAAVQITISDDLASRARTLLALVEREADQR
jgi:hypothetical protein